MKGVTVPERELQKTEIFLHNAPGGGRYEAYPAWGVLLAEDAIGTLDDYQTDWLPVKKISVAESNADLGKER
jgi:hypothetical protein